MEPTEPGVTVHREPRKLPPRLRPESYRPNPRTTAPPRLPRHRVPSLQPLTAAKTERCHRLPFHRVRDRALAGLIATGWTYRRAVNATVADLADAKLPRIVWRALAAVLAHPRRPAADVLCPTRNGTPHGLDGHAHRSVLGHCRAVGWPMGAADLRAAARDLPRLSLAEVLRQPWDGASDLVRAVRAATLPPS